MFERILLAVDGSESAGRAADAAAELARRFSSEVIVLHVREWGTVLHGFAPATTFETIDLETMQQARELVDGVVQGLEKQEVKARGEVRSALRGAVAQVILEVLRQEGANCLVMGSRGLGDVGALVLGSITHKVLHLAECPVLVVR